jgi:ubiquinone/menaquinone biosynthesis C-methylase UbiE
MDATQKFVGDVWSGKLVQKGAKWHRIPAINRHIAGKLGGGVRMLDPFLRRICEAGPLDRAISIGCGIAVTERQLVRMGGVRHFDLFDLSSDRLAATERQAAKDGIADRIALHNADAFCTTPSEVYDLVYWKSALHHMMDADAAVAWSWRALKPGGTFAMWDFVGPTRFQWSDVNLSRVNEFRASLPFEAKPIRRKTIEQMMKLDPSEAADSSNIVPAVTKYFPHAQIHYLGAAMVHIGFAGILDTILERPDAPEIFRRALAVDDELRSVGENHLACCVVQKG